MSYARAKGNPNADSSTIATPTRTGRYSEAYVTPVTNKEFFAADEGSMFVAVNPTAGTGILGHPAPTTFDETKPFLNIYNGNSAGGANIYIQRILLVDTVVSVGDTRTQFNFTIDNINRYTSGGTALTVANTNMTAGNTTGASIFAGATIAPAAGSARRLLGNYVIKGANIDVVWDQIEFVFGSTGGSTGGVLTPTTTAQHFTRYMPAIVIGPGHSFLMYQWAASQSTGPTYELAVDYIER